ncbi:insulinase family protein [Spirochaeta dissipatitropha]
MSDGEQRIAGFRLKEQIDMQEYNGRGSWWVHETTGCEVFHLHCDDPENLFAFGFPTVPADSSGVAHILEHTVLCGSRNYPLKDPFLRMLQSSVYTFLNAFTFPDKTVYPAASTVEKDLFNLMKVYGDAVFFPLLDPAMFRQEGHRLVFDDEGKLGISGVVYNEMLGAFSSQDSVEMRCCLNGLFPDTAYGHESGGDPDAIPSLTYEDFTAFHRTHYHPRNARIFIYGNIPTERYLKVLQDEFLCHFQAGSLPNRIGDQPRWNEPRRMTVPVAGDADPLTGSSVTLNWLLFPSTHSRDVLSFEILSELLLGTPGSPLQKKLLESGLGEDLSSTSGYESEIYETMFSVGLRGTSPQKTAEIEDFIMQALSEIADQGFDPDLVEGTLRRFEFRSRELGAGGNVGLYLGRRAFQGWMHGQSPHESLAFLPLFTQIRSEIAVNPEYFSELIRSNLLENQHRLTVSVVPDPEKEIADAELRQKRIDEIDAGLSEADRERIRKEEADLRAFQEAPDSPEAEESLPRLDLADVPRDIRRIPQEVIELKDGVLCYATALSSRGIVYLNIAIDVSDLSGEAELLLPFFSGVLTGLGIPGIPYDQMSHRIGLVFGGISTDVEVADHAELQEPRVMLWMRTKFLAQYADEAMQLMDEILCKADFSDTSRLREMLLEQRNDYRSSIIQSGSSYAALRAEAGLSRLELKEERLKGITQYLYLDALSAEPIEKVRTALESLRDSVIQRCRTEVQISCDSDQLNEMTDRISHRFSDLWSREYKSAGQISAAANFVEPPLPAAGKPESLLTSTSVNYIALAMPGSLIFQPGYAAQSLISHLLSTSYLWERCRMQGGAYGASAALNGLSGIFRFATYRDPQTSGSIQVFLDAFQAMLQSLPDPDLLESAVIALVGKELKPLSPGAQGLIAYRRRKLGITDDVRQENRDRLLSMTVSQISEQLEDLHDALSSGVLSMISSRSLLDKALASLPEGSSSAPEEMLRLAAANSINIKT